MDQTYFIDKPVSLKELLTFHSNYPHQQPHIVDPVIVSDKWMGPRYWLLNWIVRQPMMILDKPHKGTYRGCEYHISDEAVQVPPRMRWQYRCKFCLRYRRFQLALGAKPKRIFDLDKKHINVMGLSLTWSEDESRSFD